MMKIGSIDESGFFRDAFRDVRKEVATATKTLSREAGARVATQAKQAVKEGGQAASQALKRALPTPDHRVVLGKAPVSRSPQPESPEVEASVLQVREPSSPHLASREEQLDALEGLMDALGAMEDPEPSAIAFVSGLAAQLGVVGVEGHDGFRASGQVGRGTGAALISSSHGDDFDEELGLVRAGPRTTFCQDLVDFIRFYDVPGYSTKDIEDLRRTYEHADAGLQPDCDLEFRRLVQQYGPAGKTVHEVRRDIQERRVMAAKRRHRVSRGARKLARGKGAGRKGGGSQSTSASAPGVSLAGLGVAPFDAYDIAGVSGEEAEDQTGDPDLPPTAGEPAATPLGKIATKRVIRVQGLSSDFVRELKGAGYHVYASPHPGEAHTALYVDIPDTMAAEDVHQLMDAIRRHQVRPAGSEQGGKVWKDRRVVRFESASPPPGPKQTTHPHRAVVRHTYPEVDVVPPRDSSRGGLLKVGYVCQQKRRQGR